MTMTIRRLKKRADFLRVASKRKKWVAPGLIVQAAPMPKSSAEDGDAEPGFRVGFTVSKKVGNAVRRNRAKRRLRALAAEVMPDQASPGTDYVIIGRAATVTRPHDLLLQDFLTALKRLRVDRDTPAKEART